MRTSLDLLGVQWVARSRPGPYVHRSRHAGDVFPSLVGAPRLPLPETASAGHEGIRDLAEELHPRPPSSKAEKVSNLHPYPSSPGGRVGNRAPAPNTSDRTEPIGARMPSRFTPPKSLHVRRASPPTLS